MVPSHPNSQPAETALDPAPALPRTMLACQGKELGDIDEMIEVRTIDMPTIEQMLPSLPRERNKSMIIQCHAVALACGDVRVLSGKTRELQGPPSFPYIPGGDCAGVVWHIPNEAKESGNCPFAVGDRVAVRFNPEKVRGALAEYAVVDMTVCEKLPDSLSFEEGAVLASVAPATLLAERIQEGERVLIMGAGGGVGSHACQVMRHSQGASFLGGVSKTPDRLLKAPYNYDRAIDYTQQDPFAMQEFKDDPFDVVVDLAGGSWLRLNDDYRKGDKMIVKPASQGGRFLTLTTDVPLFEIHSMWGALKPFFFIPLFRAIKSRLWARRSLPKYTFAMSLDGERSHLTRTLNMAEMGKLKAVIDPKGSFPFTTEGVRAAFRLQETRHVQGKVVVRVRATEEKE